jgi:hypothetical protein
MAEDEDVGSEAVVARRRVSAKQEEKEFDDMLRAIMDLPLGRKWIWRLLADCRTFATAFGSEPHLSYFAGGEQNVGFRVLAQIMRACPQQYLRMVQENG